VLWLLLVLAVGADSPLAAERQRISMGTGR
jgi:hypothetical protein